jgi:chemotaxis receptor (MCP) glutamine deamidase CheD
MGHESFNVGMRNISAAEKILKMEQIQIIARSTGGSTGRKLIYHTDTNQAFIRFLQAGVSL